MELGTCNSITGRDVQFMFSASTTTTSCQGASTGTVSRWRYFLPKEHNV